MKDSVPPFSVPFRGLEMDKNFPGGRLPILKERMQDDPPPAASPKASPLPGPLHLSIAAVCMGLTRRGDPEKRPMAFWVILIPSYVLAPSLPLRPNPFLFIPEPSPLRSLEKFRENL